MPVIGLTGGIASGKSTALAVFKRLGAKIIDADRLARRAVLPGAPALRAIKKRWGQNVLHRNGRLNRSALAAVVFNDKRELAALNAIVHPEIFRMEKEAIAALQKKNKNAVIVVDAAIMLESRSHRWKDAVVVVKAREADQLARLMKCGMKRDAAIARIRMQMPLRQKLRFADYVLENEGSVAECRKNAAALYARITADLSRRAKR